MNILIFFSHLEHLVPQFEEIKVESGDVNPWNPDCLFRRVFVDFTFICDVHVAFFSDLRPDRFDRYRDILSFITVGDLIVGALRPF